MDERREQMRLNLEDFEKLKDFNEDISKEIEKSPKEIEEFYQKKILDLEKSYEKYIENLKEEYYKKGYIKGVSDKEKELKDLAQDIENRFDKELKEKIASLENSYKTVEKELYQKLKEYLDKLSNILLDNLEEIFEYLYIQDSNIDYIKDAITKTILEFKESLPIEIKVSKKLYESMRKSFSNIKVEIDENLTNSDFVIEFYDFKLENFFKEKVEVLKNEIKREIKKFT